MSTPEFIKLAEHLHGYSRNWLGLVQDMFPWGQPGTVLQDKDGPDDWQRQLLKKIDDGLDWNKALQIAVSSGHGVGKSALVSWIILCAMATCVNTRGVVTANTDSQLRTKTWVEVSKWFNLAPILHPLFEMTLTALMARDPTRRSQWRFDRITWSENNTEAFAGLHNQGSRIVVIYDEASAIPDIIWEVTEGALTDSDTEILWVVCGNPTRSSGRFRQCWTKFKRLWKTFTVDSRTVKITNKAQIAEWLRAYGEDSDFFRVRVRGAFPRVGSMQFISDQLSREASVREPVSSIWDPLVFGVDVARFGDDKSVIAIRRGRDARTIPWHVFSGADTNTLALKIIELATALSPDAIFIDEGGVGAGIVDRLKFLKLPVIGVQFGGSPERTTGKVEGAVAYANKRAEMWGLMRDWLAGGCTPNNTELHDELTNIQYGYTMIHGQDCIQLEKKADMKKRGTSSPDAADALGLTFAFPVMPSDHTDQLKRKPKHQASYDPYANAWTSEYYNEGA